MAESRYIRGVAIGQNDTAVFFADWNCIAFAGNSAFCIFDAPGKDAEFDHLSVSNTELTALLSAVAFNPMPKPKDQVAVDGVNYAVQSSSPVQDGAMVELKMRKL
ncbi:MAG TPA: hypothetical protein VMD97_02000 [Candidatus Aquilonibacter sp.]|nr:hypothetical protein [Candidatus Aquilonibacter sp.]